MGIESKKIKNVVYELFKLKLHFKQQEQKYNEKCSQLQSEIQTYMTNNRIEKMQLIGSKNESSFNVVNVKPRKIKFDIPMLCEKLPKKILDEIIIKEYKITDYKGLVSLLKESGVNPSQFKKFIDVSREVDVKKIDELSELGEICYDDIKGCYEIIPTKSYVKITEMDDEKD